MKLLYDKYQNNLENLTLDQILNDKNDVMMSSILLFLRIINDPE